MSRRRRSAVGAGVGDDPVPQVLRNVEVSDPTVLNGDATFWSRVRAIDDELGRRRPGARAPVGHRAGRAGDGRGDRRGRRGRRSRDRLVELVEHVAPTGPCRRRPESSVMCGIVGVVRRRASRIAPDLAELASRGRRGTRVTRRPRRLDERLRAAAARLDDVDAELRGAPGVHALLGDRPGFSGDRGPSLGGRARVTALEAELEAGVARRNGRARSGERGAAAARATRCGRSSTTASAPPARSPTSPVTPGRTAAALDTYLSVQVALAAIDRLEVRGRDSAGLHLSCASPRSTSMILRSRAQLAQRADDPLFRSGSVRRAVDRTLSFVYKAAAEIGELGDNTAVLRDAIRADDLLRRAVSGPMRRSRWCSATPAGRASASSPRRTRTRSTRRSPSRARPYVVGALNGDVDNYADLQRARRAAPLTEITTDAQVIPALVSRPGTRT